MTKVMLAIMDGWGIGKNYPGNAISLANTPNIDKALENYPNTTLAASGLAVGLPEGQMGNSEVGHMNIGSGRVIYQDLTLINKEVKDGSFKKNESLNEAMDFAINNGTKLHILGLVSYGGVHSHMNHLFALLEMAKEKGLKEVYVHAFLDGRDVSPYSAKDDLRDLEAKMKEIGVGEIATVSGRYYAMDRDNRWERIELAYDNMTLGIGEEADDLVKYVEDSYKNEVTDEFMLPVHKMVDGKPLTTIDDNDSVIFYNFRPDRARQMTRTFVDEDFSGFERKKIVHVDYTCMTQYDKTIENVKIAYPPRTYKKILSEVLAENNVKQLRIAETEKYAHVTFFFNGGVEEPFDGEDRILVPSPKVATYDLKPEMSANEVKEKVVEAINSEEYGVIILNFANPDMVGHTGIIDAEIKAIETVDKCMGDVMHATLKHNYDLLITADHGNAEELIDYESNEPFTAHTINPVPLIYVGNNTKDKKLKDGGKLSDLAPTMLDILGIEQPEEMTGHSLIEK